MNIISIGEILWDVFAGSEHLGGAPFNFAAHARRLGHDLVFLSAVGADTRGDRALARVAELGLSTRFIRRVPQQPTGFVSVELDDENQPRFAIHRPAAYDYVQLDEKEYEELSGWRPDWIYFGTLHQMGRQARGSTEQLLRHCPQAKRFYDVNLRAESYTAALVCHLLGSADVVKLNEAEALEVAQMFGTPVESLEGFCRDYAARFGWEAVCVTRGADGCVLLVGGEYVEAEGYTVQVSDTVGAGDAFAAAFLHGLAAGWTPQEIADSANRLGALVASRHGAVPPWTLEECQLLSDRGVRR